MLSANVQYAVEKLLELEVLNEAGLERLATLFRGMEALMGTVQQDESPKKPRRLAPPAGFHGNGKPLRFPSGDLLEEGDYYLGGDNPNAAEDLPDSAGSEPVSTGSTTPAPATTLSLARTPWGPFNPTALEMRNLRDGMTVKQIARLYGVSVATVQNRLREYGLTNPRR